MLPLHRRTKTSSHHARRGKCEKPKKRTSGGPRTPMASLSRNVAKRFPRSPKSPMAISPIASARATLKNRLQSSRGTPAHTPSDDAPTPLNFLGHHTSSPPKAIHIPDASNRALRERWRYAQWKATLDPTLNAKLTRQIFEVLRENDALNERLKDQENAHNHSIQHIQRMAMEEKESLERQYQLEIAQHANALEQQSAMLEERLVQRQAELNRTFQVEMSAARERTEHSFRAHYHSILHRKDMELARAREALEMEQMRTLELRRRDRLVHQRLASTMEECSSLRHADTRLRNTLRATQDALREMKKRVSIANGDDDDDDDDGIDDDGIDAPPPEGSVVHHCKAQLAEDIICPICMDERKQCVLIGSGESPCGHVFCISCAETFDRCPMCRADVQQRHKIHL